MPQNIVFMDDENPLYHLQHGTDDLPLDPLKPIVREKLIKLQYYLSEETKSDYQLPECAYADVHGGDGVKMAVDVDGAIWCILAAHRFRAYKDGWAILRRQRRLKWLNRPNSARLFGYTPGDEFKERTPSEREQCLRRTKEFINDCMLKYSKEIGTSSAIMKCPDKKPLKFVAAAKRRRPPLEIVRAPIHPDDQRSRAMALYTEKRQKLNASQSIIKRCLLEKMSTNKFQLFPTTLIIRSLRNIDSKRLYMPRALLFVEQETKQWSQLRPEIALAIYLLDRTNGISEREALFILVLLINLQEEFRYNVRLNVVETLAMHHEGRILFQIEPMEPEFPRIRITSPVPWSVAFKSMRRQIEKKLMIAHPIVCAVRRAWLQMMDGYVIVPQSRFQSIFTGRSFAFTSIVDACCRECKDMLLKKWLPRVVNIISEMVGSFKPIMTDRNQCIHFYRCLNTLLALQIQDMIHQSLRALVDLVCRPAWHSDAIAPALNSIKINCVGKYPTDFGEHEDDTDDITHRVYIESDEDPHLVIESLGHRIVIDANSEELTDFIAKCSGKWYSEPNIQELPDIFMQSLHEILCVGENIPQLEYFMSHDDRMLGYLPCLRSDCGQIPDLIEEMRAAVEHRTNIAIERLRQLYSKYSLLFDHTMMTVVEWLCDQIDKELDPGALDALIEAINKWKAQVFLSSDCLTIDNIQLDVTEVRDVIKMYLNQLIDTIIAYVSFINGTESEAINESFEAISIRASDIPRNISDLVEIQSYVNECRETQIYELKSRMLASMHRSAFLLSHSILRDTDRRMCAKLMTWPAKIDAAMHDIAAQLNVVRKMFEQKLIRRGSQLKMLLKGAQNRIITFCQRQILDSSLHVEEIMRNCMHINTIAEQLNEFGREAQSINADELSLQMAISEFSDLQTMANAVAAVESLWKTAYFVEKNFEIWYYGSFADMDGEKVSTIIDDLHKNIQKVIKNLANNREARRVAEKYRTKINQFKMYTPILEVICQKGMTDQHWMMISKHLGLLVNPTVCHSLCSLIECGIMDVVDKLNEVSLMAAKEHELRTLLIRMQTEWNDIEFVLSEYKTSGSYVLTALDDVNALLDDHILKAQSMRSSSPANEFGDAILTWEQKLMNMQAILEAWTQVQSMWMYLEPIFSSEDIKRQLPEDGRRFTAVNFKWKRVMKNVCNEKHVIHATDYPSLLEILTQARCDLENIQRGLNSYLEKKRLFFARFFFLSNDELLEILSETKDPTRVQPHMKKCFEGINALTFDSQQIICAMNSSEGECVQLVSRVNPHTANGLVELWLKDIESGMLQTMRNQIQLSYDSYGSSLRKQWVVQWPSQIVQLISCAMWTQETEAAIAQHRMTEYQSQCTAQIADIVDLVRGQLTRANTITIEALIVLDVHARDILGILIDKRCDRVEDFSWLSQLRYYRHNQTMDVSMLSTTITYGCEYLGNVSRLVVTPLTDRCFRTIMGAIKLNLGSAPEGPAGTGKTESCKDLAKAVGKKCIVFNCSDGLDYKALGKFFKGIIQSGAWAVFDEFNRIELEVLSVIGQQILTIQQAVAAKFEVFEFEETELHLDPTCNVFITMNPGYAGRTELPDNLKVLFRTVAMMVPDYALIGEITLYSCGFDRARILAHKIVHTYKLCSEQLSSQKHYDYGMRAVKSVLLAAGTLRRKYPNEDEDRVVLKAIIDINLPKFVQQDIPLFRGIYGDLFPNVTLPDAGRDLFIKYIRVHLKKANLQATDWMIEKILQIYEMILVRHGLMVVGGTMAGKSVAWKTLAATLVDINRNNEEDGPTIELSVNYRIINAKALTMDSLYGKIDMASQEWSDGVLSKTFREMVNSMNVMRNWVMLDSPVDAVWIENLNTLVLMPSVTITPHNK